MSADVLDLAAPIRADRPCGDSLEDTPTMGSFDAYQLFGQAAALDPPPLWDEIRQRSLETLATSKDIRILAHLAVARLRLEGLAAFFDTLTVAAHWLESYWADVYPLIEEDAIMRRNALASFADPVAIIDPLRRAVLVSSRQHGRFSLRDIDIASGAVKPVEEEIAPDAARIDAAFESAALDELKSLQQGVLAGLTALKAMDAQMRDKGGTEAGPGFDRLLAQLNLMNAALLAHIDAHPANVSAAAAAGTGDGAGAGGTMRVGAIKSREDAVGAMEAVATFFKQTEPSSPIPMLLERAARLVSKNFLEVLADVAPDAVPSAKAAVGLRNE
jgi:type VI secretion system protein ImpA